MLAGLGLFLNGLNRPTGGTASMLVGGLLALIGLALLAWPQSAPVDTPGEASRPDFTIVLRGYDRAQVDQLIDRASEALRSASMEQRLAVRSEIKSGSLEIVLRGYLMPQVDDHLKELAAALATPPANRPPAAAV